MQQLEISNTDYDKLAKTLRRVDFFKPLSLDQLSKAIPYIMLFGYEDGETVFKQGSEGDAFYIVLDGTVSVKISKFPLGLFPKEVAKLTAGGYFGEMALFSKETRTATCVCKGKARLFVLLRKEFTKFLNENPGFKEKVEQTVLRRGFQNK
jgi:CRP-like cAMP-binding protein